MSSPDRFPLRPVRRLAVASLALALPLLAACTVQPLYANRSGVAGETTGIAADLSSISIKPVEQRYAQEVRNHLIFLFNRGRGQPATSAYTLVLTVTALNESAAVVQVAEENEPSAGTVTLTASYVLTATQGGERISAGTRQLASSYDIPRQEFAAVRAQRDAENRAARELAELLQLSISQDLAKLQ